MMATLFIQDVSELSEPFDLSKPFEFRSLKAFRVSISQSLSSFDLSKPFEFRSLKDFRALKAFRDSEVIPMSSLEHTWYINMHPHMQKAEAGERVRVSSLYYFY